MEQGYIQHIVIGVGINVRKQEFPEEIRDRQQPLMNNAASAFPAVS